MWPIITRLTLPFDSFKGRQTIREKSSTDPDETGELILPMSEMFSNSLSVTRSFVIVFVFADRPTLKSRCILTDSTAETEAVNEADQGSWSFCTLGHHLRSSTKETFECTASE